MDCETEEEVQVQLESLKDVWIEQEKAYLPAGKQPSYHQYISEKVTGLSFFQCKGWPALLSIRYIIHLIYVVCVP